MLFDQNERSGDKKPRNNVSSFLILMISGLFRPNSELRFPWGILVSLILAMTPLGATISGTNIPLNLSNQIIKSPNK